MEGCGVRGRIRGLDGVRIWLHFLPALLPPPPPPPPSPAPFIRRSNIVYVAPRLLLCYCTYVYVYLFLVSNVVLFCVVTHLCMVFDFQPPDLGGVELARKCRPAYPGSVHRSSIPVCIHMSLPHPSSPLPYPHLHLVVST